MPSVIEIIDIMTPGLAIDSGRDIYIELAANLTNSCFFGTNYNFAVALRASHMWILAQRGEGEPGQINSKKEGDLSVGFSSSQSDDGDLSQTHYGTQLENLIKSGIPGVSIAGFDMSILCC